MKPQLIALSLLIGPAAVAGSLPVITSSPQNQTVTPGSSATFSVAASGATSYQWRFNGTNIPGATGATFQLTGAQATNVGYYLAIARNENGWVPSQMAFLAVSGASGGGTVPLSGGPAYSQFDGQPINNATARAVAGPALDQMQPVGTSVPVVNGYFNATLPPTRTVPNAAPGQTVYYRVDITYTGSGYTQPSTVTQLVAGGGIYPTPGALVSFPIWPEWPEPWIQGASPTNQVCLTGTSLSLHTDCIGYGDFGIPSIQWRKDGRPISDRIPFTGSPPTYSSSTDVLTLTKLQPADAGIYDTLIFGNQWEPGPKISLSIQFTNGPGVLRSPRFSGTNFLCDLLGVPSLNYAIQCSTNLSAWSDLYTVSNVTGTVTFTNALAPEGRRFYRALLLQ